MLIDALTEPGPEQLDLFGAPPPPSNATARHAAIALRCAGTVNRIASIAYGEKPSRSRRSRRRGWDQVGLHQGRHHGRGVGQSLDLHVAGARRCAGRGVDPWCVLGDRCMGGEVAIDARGSFVRRSDQRSQHLPGADVRVRHLARAIQHDVQTAAVKRLVPS
jgi:hypothetical protein